MCGCLAHYPFHVQSLEHCILSVGSESAEMFGSKALLTDCILISPPAIQFVLSDEFSHMRPEERQQLLHVRACMSRLSLTGPDTICYNLHA